MRDMPKRIKRLLREQAMLAHEEELRRALLPIAAAFEEWKKGGLGSGELRDMIHEYHQGPARRLFSKYNNGPLDAVVAYAIVSGILDASRVPDELLEYLSTAIAFYEKSSPAHEEIG
jgi:hypothetical protein